MENSNRMRGLLLLFILTAAALRLGGAADHDLWIDEAFSLWMARQPLSALFSTAAALDHHPPFYYLLLRGWIALVGESEYALRSLGALLGIVTVPLFYQLARRLLVGGRAGLQTGGKIEWEAVPSINPGAVILIAVLLLVLAPFHVARGQEARMYALLAFSAVIVLYLAVELLHHTDRGALYRRGAALGVAQTFVMWSHNTGALLFPLALNLAFVLLWVIAAVWRAGRGTHTPYIFPALGDAGARTRLMWAWGMGQVVAVVLWLPWAPALLHQAEDVAQRFWIPSPESEQLWLAFQTFSFGHPPPGWPWGAGWVALFFGVALSGIYALRRNPAQLVWLLALWLAGPAASLLVSILLRPIFWESTLIWTTFAYYLILAAGVVALAHGVARWFVPGALSVPARKLARNGSMLVLTLVLAGGMVGGVVGHYTGGPKEAWRAAVAQVMPRIEPGDLVLFHASWTQLPFMYYAHRYDRASIQNGTADLYSIDSYNIDSMARAEYDEDRAIAPRAFFDVALSEMDAAVELDAARQHDWETGGIPVDLFARGELEPEMLPDDVAVLQQRIASRARVWLIYSHAWYTDPAGLVLETLTSELKPVFHTSLTGVEVFLFTRPAD